MFDELRDLNKEITEKREKLAELRAMATSMTVSYDSERVQTSPQDRLSNIMCKIIMLENEIDGMVEDYTAEVQRAKLRIYRIEKAEWQDILYAHYVERKTFGEIARHRGVTVNSVKKLNGRAIKCLKSLDGTDNL